MIKKVVVITACITILAGIYLAWSYRVSSLRLELAECKPEGGPYWAVLQGESAKRLVERWCPVPADQSRYWVPSSEDIARLEQRLAPFLEKHRKAEGVAPLSAYVRQYAGFTDRGRQTICVNLYAAKELEGLAWAIRSDPNNWKYLPKRRCPEDQWRHELLDADDGGSLFCGVSYEPELGAFYKFDCNGG
jgi:hypothetical protein